MESSSPPHGELGGRPDCSNPPSESPVEASEGALGAMGDGSRVELQTSGGCPGARGDVVREDEHGDLGGTPGSSIDGALADEVKSGCAPGASLGGGDAVGATASQSPWTVMDEGEEEGEEVPLVRRIMGGGTLRPITRSSYSFGHSGGYESYGTGTDG